MEAQWGNDSEGEEITGEALTVLTELAGAGFETGIVGWALGAGEVGYNALTRATIHARVARATAKTRLAGDLKTTSSSSSSALEELGGAKGGVAGKAAVLHARPTNKLHSPRAAQSGRGLLTCFRREKGVGRAEA